MKLDLERTIVAVGSGVATARRAIVRISGKQTRDILIQLAGEHGEAKQRCQLTQATSACCIPLAIDIGWGSRQLPAQVYYWPTHRSFTGEPCAELHVLGALTIVESLTERIIALGASPAERGEFTLRSFLAGKLDLTQAEAVLGVIQADSASELTAALMQLGGNLSGPVRELRDQLIEVVAHLEAGLDFVEEDIEFISASQLASHLQAIADRLRAISDQLHSRGARSRSARVVLVGLPNAGKSSLFNALLKSERAIVSPQAGTTRDAVAESTWLGDMPVELIDTAGLEELQESSPRGLAQGVLNDRLRQADVAVFCIDLSSPISPGWLSSQAGDLHKLVATILRVGTKADLGMGTGPSSVESIGLATDIASQCDVCVSSFWPKSMDTLRAKLLDALANSRTRLHSDVIHETAIRCRGSIEIAREALHRALELIADGGGEELIAAELRVALDDLSSVIGEVHNEEILGQIFSRFCIGK